MNKVSKIFVIFCILILNQSFAINSKENKLINNSPTASLVHTVAGNVVDLVRENDEVTLTATFDHDINSDFTMLIYGEGAQVFNGGMTRISSTVYTYTYTVDSVSGVQNFYFDNGQDLEGNPVTPNPSSGASIYHNPSVLNYSYENFDLNNPNAVKINIIYLTNDINLITLPWPTPILLQHKLPR